MCATDENAMSRFMSFLREAAERAVDDADTDNNPIHGAQLFAAPARSAARCG